MEALSPTMEEGRLVEWKKQEGDAVAVGDVLAGGDRQGRHGAGGRPGGTLLKQVIPAGHGPRLRPGRRHRRAGRGRGRCRGTGEEAGAEGNQDRGAGDPARAGPESAAGDAPAPPAEAVTEGNGQQPAPRPAAAPPRGAARRTGKGVTARPSDGGRAGDRSGIGLRLRARGSVVARDLERPARLPARRCAAPAAPSPVPAAPRIPHRVPFADVPLTQIRKTIARRLAQSIGPIPRSTSRPRWTWSARGGAGSAAGRGGREGVVQRHHHQGDRDGPQAASRVQRLVAGRPHPLLERGPRQHGGGDRGRADHAGDPPYRPQVAAGDHRESPTSPAARGAAQARGTPAGRSRSPTWACSTSASSPRSSTRRRPASSRWAEWCSSRWCTRARWPSGADAAHDVVRSPGDRRGDRRAVPPDAQGDAGESAGDGLLEDTMSP